MGFSCRVARLHFSGFSWLVTRFLRQGVLDITARSGVKCSFSDSGTLSNNGFLCESDTLDTYEVLFYCFRHALYSWDSHQNTARFSLGVSSRILTRLVTNGFLFVFGTLQKDGVIHILGTLLNVGFLSVDGTLHLQRVSFFS